MEFEKTNVNPKGRITGDCSTRAIATTLGISWEETLRMQMEEALKCYYDPTSKQVVERVLERFGYIKMKQPRKADGKKYTVGELNQLLTQKQMQEGVLVTVAHHHTCIKDGVIKDTWNCSRKSVRNYYILMK